VKKINPNGVSALAKDVEYLAEFVDSLNVPILRENLDELQQTVQLARYSTSFANADTPLGLIFFTSGDNGCA
jgi:hypothetical protein